ncbi:hypothetical protein QQP08_016996 [Theobroma cacao]|uniref:Uncharacterized protein n=1 Tax=Theobroma cacao TaxID=3641 RepID=A0A061EUZ0_THECC|nr:Uncharacterized protein TCM_022948 [Theobroma cacao]WRX24509.1 hypothetical protein QQP08_016996 [Theobroma cacao]
MIRFQTYKDVWKEAKKSVNCNTQTETETLKHLIKKALKRCHNASNQKGQPQRLLIKRYWSYETLNFFSFPSFSINERAEICRNLTRRAAIGWWWCCCFCQHSEKASLNHGFGLQIKYPIKLPIGKSARLSGGNVLSYKLILGWLNLNNWSRPPKARGTWPLYIQKTDRLGRHWRLLCQASSTIAL